ncbi:hypothetical protein JTB14_003946 [Gonioctena quinquepunctata]|nr:hypothetical protein JTB14_003946 [Gonioctena quinquepunctata]
MAPVNRMRTYRGSNNSVNNSVDAFNVLFAKNMTKRLIGRKKKKKCFIRPLPHRKSRSMLIDDSLQISTEDTFDKLLKGNINNKVESQSLTSESFDMSEKSGSIDMSKKGKSITQTSSFYSPIMTRRRKKIQLEETPSSYNLSKSTNLSDNPNPYLFRMKEPTVDRIDVSVEIEGVRKEHNFSSYVDKDPSLSVIANNTQSVSNVPTRNFPDKQIHCSTPLLTLKSQHKNVNHTISPIQNLSSFFKESIEEIHKWGKKFPVTQVDEHLTKKRAETSDFSCSRSLQNIKESSNVRESYLSLRKRKIWKSDEKKKKNSSWDSHNNFTVSLKTFDFFESRNSCYNLIDINSNRRKNSKVPYTPLDYVTKRRKICSDYHPKIEDEERFKKSRSYKSNEFLSNCDKTEEGLVGGSKDSGGKRQKTLVVNLTRVSELQPRKESEHVESILSSFEEFYSRCLIQDVNQSQPSNKINAPAAKEPQKDLLVNITRNHYDPPSIDVTNVQDKHLLVNVSLNVDIFEKFYSKNYSSSENSLNTCLETDDSKSIIQSSYVKSNDKVTDIIENEDVRKYIEKSLKPVGENNEVAGTTNYKSRSSSKNEIDTEASIHGESYLSNKSAMSNSTVQDHSSDIIESSVLECNQVDSDGFKVPILQKNFKPKTILLKAGKHWRRSYSMYRRSSIILGGIKKEEESLNKLNCGVSEAYTQGPNRRYSIKVISLEQFHSVKKKKDSTLLEDYALNTSYVPDQVLDNNLENSLRCLSLRNSVTSKPLPLPAPVTAREVVLRRCGQTGPEPFSQCYPESVLQNCQKIGEGVYGEVFLFRNPKGGTSVVKVIPIEGNLIVNGERQKKFDEILSEVIIATELSNLRNNNRNATSAFSEVQEIQCVQGRYPEKLLDLWELYEESHGSENDCPDIFREDQLYIVLQLANGGKDLESYLFNNASQAYTMFKQVAFALAVAENELRFEHRDLHWGNVLLSTVEKNKVVDFSLDGETYSVPTRGVEATIIDFTLSRIEYDGVVIFNDLALDPELFTAEGDYQFEIYKLMQKKNRNNWLEFEPYSNLLWLHYTLDKAITALRYKNPQSKTHKENLMKLKQLYNGVLSYKSVKEFVLNTLL